MAYNLDRLLFQTMSWGTGVHDDEELPLVIIFRLSDQRPLNIQANIKTLLPMVEQYAKHGNAIISVGDGKARIRRLPIG